MHASVQPSVTRTHSLAFLCKVECINRILIIIIIMLVIVIIFYHLPSYPTYNLKLVDRSDQIREDGGIQVSVIIITRYLPTSLGRYEYGMVLHDFLQPQ